MRPHRDFDVVCVAVQNTAVEKNRVEGLAALKRIEAQITTFRDALDEITEGELVEITKLSVNARDIARRAIERAES